MFAAPRFVAIDDKEMHLRAILDAFQEMGVPCIGIRFDPQTAFDKQTFRGVRALFLDLHLVEGGAKTDQKSHYAQIQTILEDNISDEGGPFILVLWTEHAQNAPDLIAYLDKNLDPALPHARPLAVIPLAKDKFINVENGAQRAAGVLRDAIARVLTENPQMKALIDWEMDVLAAAGATLSSLLALVPAIDRTTAAFPAAVDVLLSRLAREAVGRAHVASDPRLAVTYALAPILADRIVNQNVDAEAKAVWAKAVTRHDDDTLPKVSLDDAAHLNHMLHIADTGPENVSSADWGAVSELPAAMWVDAVLQETFGVTQAELLNDEFKVKPEQSARCRARMIRIGASCDYAQDRPGPVSLLLGMEVPADRKPSSATNAIWVSPVLRTPGSAEAFRLHVHCRLAISRVAATVCRWTPCYRLREALLMQLVTHAGTYASRPAIVRFDP